METQTSTTNCGKFWGPFLPPFWGEKQVEVGGSYWMTYWTMFGTRLASSFLLLFLGWKGVSLGYTFLHRLDRFVVILCGLSFFLLALTSLQCALGRTDMPVPYLARIAAPLHHTTASMTLLVLFELYETPHNYFVFFFVALNVLPFLLVCADLALGAKLKFRLTYIFFPQIPLGFHTLFLFLAWHFFVVHHVGRFVFAHVMLFFSSIFAVALSRVPALWVKYKGTNNGEETDPFDTEQGIDW